MWCMQLECAVWGIWEIVPARDPNQWYIDIDFTEFTADCTGSREFPFKNMRQGAHLRQSPAANPCSRHLPLQTNPCSKELQQTIWKFNICILGMNGPGLSISWHGYLTRHQILKPVYFCKHTQPHLFSGKLDFILAKFPLPLPHLCPISWWELLPSMVDAMRNHQRKLQHLPP